MADAFRIQGVSNLGHAYACLRCGALVVEQDRELHVKSHKGWKATV